jgi:hypothetical protein
MAVALAGKAVSALREAIKTVNEGGFKYLTTHGDLDVRHSEFFENLINHLDKRHLPMVIETTGDFYKLYGDLFRDLDQRRTTALAS